MRFPEYRPRRLRRNEKLRGLIQETELSRQHLVYPLFVKEMSEERIPIPSMPDIYQFSVDGLLKEIEQVISLSVPAVLLFGVPEHKDELGAEPSTRTALCRRPSGRSGRGSGRRSL